MKASVNIGSNSGIETAIAAEYYVDRPTHTKLYDASPALFTKKSSKTAAVAPTII